MTAPALYLCVDESGNFDFSPRGTKFFVMSCVVVSRPFPAQHKLLDVRYDQLESGLDLQHFHASEDRQIVRDKVFGAIAEDISEYRAYSVVIPKNRTEPTLRAPEALYPLAFEWLMKYILPRHCGDEVETIVVITDDLPERNKRRAMEKGVKMALKPLIPAGKRYYLYHHQSRSDINLQIADYFGWAIYRKWENNDTRSYDLVSPAIVAEGELFAGVGEKYY
jgi:hypothetical protein